MKFKLSCNSIQKVSKQSIFSAAECDALFDALLIDDVINLDVALPKKHSAFYTQDQLNACYQISHQLWREGLSRELLKELINKIYLQGQLDAEDKYAFYCMRAKIKHLRFAYVMFDERHKYPRIFHWMTAVMGYMQDVLKSPQHSSVKFAAMLVKFFLIKPIYTAATKEFDKFTPSTPENFRHYLWESIKFISLNLDKDKLTSHEFHEVRRVVSRLVAFYDCMYILYPSNDEQAVLLYLSTINGLMGNLHDDLIVAKFNKTQNYHKDTFTMPDEIKQRLMAYVNFYKIQANLS